MSNQLALGINISADQVSLALLKKTRQTVQLVKSASAPLPENMIVAGNVKNPAQLAKIIKDLCSKNGMNTSNAVLSLFAKPSLLRIMDLPRDVGGNVKQFVSEELKHYSPFAGKTIGHDFCALKSSKTNRVLLGACDEDKAVVLIQACNRIGVIIRAIEPSPLGAVRAIYSTHIAKKFATNVMVAYVNDGTATFFVFKDGLLDFIKTASLSTKNFDAETVQVLVDEVAAVKQYYQLELGEFAKKWEFFVTGPAAAADLQGILTAIKSNLPDDTVTSCSWDNISADTSVAASNISADIAAVGMAMKLFDNGPAELKINLLPDRTDDAHNLQKFGLITANVAVIAFLAVLLAIPVIKSKIQVVQEACAKQLKANNLAPMEKLLTSQNQYTSSAKFLSEQAAALKTLCAIENPLDYAAILQEFQRRIPRNVQISKLTTKPQDRSMTIFGFSSSYEEVYMFTKLLSRSSMVRSASLVKTEVESSGSGLISYSMLVYFNAKENDPNAR